MVAKALAVLVLLQDAGAKVAGLESSGVESALIVAVSWLRLSIETVGAVIIAIGVVLALARFAASLRHVTAASDYTSIRLLLARYLALALEFQLGADILSTAIAPSWDQIGKLGAIAVIRTALNYFLSREMEQERRAGGASEGIGSAGLGRARQGHGLRHASLGFKLYKIPTKLFLNIVSR